VPVILNRAGVKQLIRLPLDEKETADFQKSAGIIKNVVKSLGL
jgi:malate/lactate dehydrogenase